MATPTVSTYEQQAIDFLQSTGCEFSVTYLRSGKYFPDDKEERDIYYITLKRGLREYKFEFGQSLNNSGFYYKKGVRSYKIDRKLLDENITASYIRNKIDFGFIPNTDTIHYPSAPTAYDVLASLTKYDPGTFEDFCGEYGYDTDSKKAEKTYNAVKDEFLNLSRLFTDAEIEQLQEIN